MKIVQEFSKPHPLYSIFQRPDFFLTVTIQGGTLTLSCNENHRNIYAYSNKFLSTNLIGGVRKALHLGIYSSSAMGRSRKRLLC